MSRQRTTVVLGAAAALALVLAVSPLAPDRQPTGQPTEAAIRLAADESPYRPLTSSAAAPTRITPAAERTIAAAVGRSDVVRGRTRLTERTLTRRAIADLATCTTFEGQRYCVGVGWTNRTPGQVHEELLAEAQADSGYRAARRAGSDTTGDLRPMAFLNRLAARSAPARRAAQVEELRSAAASVGKIWLLRHEIQGVPLPRGFLERHPEARRYVGPARVAAQQAERTMDHTDTAVRAATAAYPSNAKILSSSWTSEQSRTYWCGPASMQMIAWNWQKKKRWQGHWAKRLGTTTQGSSIWQMVKVTNEDTGWDRESYAGKYITLDISDWSYAEWYRLMRKHLSQYRAPVILHPVLLKRYYSYLDDDASGHFQVGRGYRNRGGKTDHLGYLEPWNQQRFDPSEPFIHRLQWRSAPRQYAANQAHFQHNVGV